MSHVFDCMHALQSQNVLSQTLYLRWIELPPAVSSTLGSYIIGIIK